MSLVRFLEVPLKAPKPTPIRSGFFVSTGRRKLAFSRLGETKNTAAGGGGGFWHFQAGDQRNTERSEVSPGGQTQVRGGIFAGERNFQFDNLTSKFHHSNFTLGTPCHKNFETLLTSAQRVILQKYAQYLRGLRLSTSTVVTYRNFIVFLLLFWKDRPLTNLNNADIQRFTEIVVERRNYSISTHRQLISALKHFGDRFTESRLEPTMFQRPNKSRSLPAVLSKEEVIDLLRVTYNLKHRTILALMYSCGLRISEALHLKLADIDMDRRQLVVRQSKGRKDRYIVLAESTIPLILNYVSSFKPQYYLFQGAKGGIYSASSIRAFLKRSCRRARIKKRVSPHTLRHSYATHLIENGVNLRLVQELLGHSKPETTMIYTHVAKKDLLAVQSPLDRALLDLRTTDKDLLTKSLSGNLKG